MWCGKEGKKGGERNMGAVKGKFIRPAFWGKI